MLLGTVVGRGRRGGHTSSHWEQARSGVAGCEDGDPFANGSASPSSSSRNASTTSTVPAPEITSRPGYDRFVHHHLISHSTPQSQGITLKAATVMIARAHLAKKIVAMRRAQLNCMSDIAMPPPPQRSYSEEERHAEALRAQMSRDELTLRAAAEAFSVTIHVVTTEHDNWLLRYDSQEGGGDAGDFQRRLFLCYVSPIHYNVVAPLTKPHGAT